MSFPDLDEPILPDDPQRDPRETAFLKGVMEDPDDDATRLVFADWLEEEGKPDKAAFVRLEVEMSRLPQTSERFADIKEELLRLDEVIGGRWSRALVRTGRLLNCGSQKTSDPVVRFAYECPNRWADLTPTENRGVRYCDECRKNVYRCDSKEEAEKQAAAGQCVAISSRLSLALRSEYALPKPPATESAAFADDEVEMGEVEMVGLPMHLSTLTPPPSPYELWAEELFARQRKRWWQFWR